MRHWEMRNRISHFTTKRIEITAVTRPVPKIITVNEVQTPKTTSLAQKLQLGSQFCSYQVSKRTDKRTKLSSPKAASNKILQQLKTEAAYASKLENLIRYNMNLLFFPYYSVVNFKDNSWKIKTSIKVCHCS